MGEMPAASVLRPVSRLTRCGGLVLRGLGRRAAGELVEGREVVLCFWEGRGDLG